MLDPTRERYPTSKGKGEAPARLWGGVGGEIVFRIIPHIHPRHLQGSNKTSCATGDPTETEPDLSLNV